jgi:di/tricarboxylate transporter
MTTAPAPGSLLHHQEQVRVTGLLSSRRQHGMHLSAMVDLVVEEMHILYPVQSAANLLAYGSGYFDTGDVRRLGLGMLSITLAVVLLILPYWALLGLPLA